MATGISEGAGKVAITQLEDAAIASDGDISLTLHANEHVTIDGLPAGATYTVVETPVPSGWTLVKQQDTTGIIAGI